VLIAVSQGAIEAKRSLLYPGWALVSAALTCGYNFFEVGLPEGPLTMRGHLLSVERFSRWVDPVLLDIQFGPHWASTGPSLLSTLSSPYHFVATFTHVLRQSFNPSTTAFLGGSIVLGTLSLALSLRRAGSRASTPLLGVSGQDTIAIGAYLLCVLALLLGLRAVEGSGSLERFTDFIGPLGIALGVVFLTAIWRVATGSFHRGMVAVGISGVVSVSVFLGYPSVFSQLSHKSVEFFIGKKTYAEMEDDAWNTVIAYRLASLIPSHEKAELLTLMPGFTAIPATPFERPDGASYIRDISKVFYGSPAEAAAIYSATHINYFLFDVSGRSSVLWNGFAPLFTPESIRSRLRLVTHVESNAGDLYLLTWNHEEAPDDGEPFRVFLQKWSDELTLERRSGYFHDSYEVGARRQIKLTSAP
jgi:hypothetical protein